MTGRGRPLDKGDSYGHMARVGVGGFVGSMGRQLEWKKERVKVKG